MKNCCAIGTVEAKFGFKVRVSLAVEDNGDITIQVQRHELGNGGRVLTNASSARLSSDQTRELAGHLSRAADFAEAGRKRRRSR